MNFDISVIIPSKDRLWALPRAVSSCRSSSLKIQIIVIDDESKDGTRDWLKAQPDILAVAGEGWGKPWGVNKALPHVSGKYLRYLDSDDWLNPGANEMQFEIAEREQADLVVSGVDIYEEMPASDSGPQHSSAPRLTERHPWQPTDDFIAQQLGESQGSHYSSFLFRRDFVKDIPHRTLFPATDFASRDDRCFMLEVALRQPKLAVCDTPALCHFQHGRGRLQFQGGFRGDGTNIQHFYIYRQILTLLKQRGQLSERRKKAAAKVLWPLAHWIAYTHLDEACQVAEWVKRLDPQFKPAADSFQEKLQRWVGFRSAQRLLRIRRAVLRPFRARPTARSFDLPV